MMHKPNDLSTALRYMAGPLFLAACAATYNAIAYHRRHPTISDGIRWVARQGGGAEFAGAVIGGLLAHWLLNTEKDTSP
jgi:hypothetical protein